MKKITIKALIVLVSVIAIIGVTASSKPAGSPDDPYSEAADLELIQQSLDSTETIDQFKNTPVFTYRIMDEDPPYEDGSYGELLYEKLFNVDAVVVRAETEEQRNVILASQKTPDLLWVHDAGLYGDYVKQGILAPITEEMIRVNMPNYYQIMMDNYPRVLADISIDGKIYGIPRLNFSNHVEPAAIRADWLKNVGINKVPTTLAELETAFMRFRNNDPDQNGQKDTYAMTASTDDPERMFQSIFGIYDVNPFYWTFADDGSVVYGFTTDRVKQALIKLSEWYAAGIIDPEFVTDRARTDQADIALKFASGRVGYMDSITFNQYQWDNSGHVNAKWVAQNPEWQPWFESDADDYEKLSIGAVTDFDNNMIEPYYILLPPVQGPYGPGLYRNQGLLDDFFCFGTPILDEPGKLEKMMQMLDYVVSHADVYVDLAIGLEGLHWVYDENGNVSRWSEGLKHALFDEHGQAIGTGKFFGHMFNANPDFLRFGGAKLEQRYGLLAPPIEEFGALYNPVPIALPSQAAGTAPQESSLLEYMVNAIIEGNVESTFDAAVQTWYRNGGTQLTKEANDFYFW